MWTEYSGSEAPLSGSGNAPAGLPVPGLARHRSVFRAACTSRSSTVTTVPLNSCLSHWVAPMRMRSPTAISSGSVTRPSRSRLTSMTARFASGVRARIALPHQPRERPSLCLRAREHDGGCAGLCAHVALPVVHQTGERLLFVVAEMEPVPHDTTPRWPSPPRRP